jgi:hypothetical protein
MYIFKPEVGYEMPNVTTQKILCTAWNLQAELAIKEFLYSVNRILKFIAADLNGCTTKVSCCSSNYL